MKPDNWSLTYMPTSLIPYSDALKNYSQPNLARYKTEQFHILNWSTESQQSSKNYSASWKLNPYLHTYIFNALLAHVRWDAISQEIACNFHTNWLLFFESIVIVALSKQSTMMYFYEFCLIYKVRIPTFHQFLIYSRSN